jgi:hypothetical protein
MNQETGVGGAMHDREVSGSGLAFCALSRSRHATLSRAKGKT